MIVWIAAWPHSGTALCRNLIEQTLGLPTFSKYDEPELVFMFGCKTTKFINEWCLDAYIRMLNDKERATIIKTHGYEANNSPTIFLLRDGRNAIAGLSRFWNKPVQTIITGEESGPFMDWSTHFKVWNPYNRPETLILKYEDMLKEPDKAAAAIAKALQVEVKKPFENNQEEYRKRWPQLFKPRHSDWRLDFSPEDIELFWRLHEKTMIATGYGNRKEAEANV